MLKALKEDKILGFPVWMFIIVDVIMIFLARMDWLLTDMVKVFESDTLSEFYYYLEGDRWERKLL